MSLAIKHFYRFEDFTVDTDQKVLLRQHRPLPLTPKAFDTLLILVENSGRIVKKEDLMNRLWPDSFVEESNLTFNIQQLRKSLGDNARRPRYIETVPRRGYRFIANVAEAPGPDSKGNHGVRPARKIAIAFVATLVAVLTGVGLILWKLSSVSNQNLGEFLAALPLKVQKLTAGGQSKYVAISADGKYLAYTLGFVKKQSIWLRQLATDTNIQIVPATDPVHGLAFSNSGEFLYFVKDNPNAMYRVSLLGGVPTRVVDGLEGKFSLSPDDRRIAFIRVLTNSNRQQNYALIIANADGAAETTLLVREYPDKLDAPVWSPDGDSIICAYGNSAGGSQGVSLVAVSVIDGATRELSAERFYNIDKIARLPHERGLIMSALKKPEGYRQLWRVSYPNMEFRQITAGLSSYSDLSITADAAKVVASQTNRAFDIWIGESREPQHLKKITAATDNLCWSPDGRLVYTSMAGGNPDLWIMQPDETGQKQLTVDAAANASPAVAPDNRYIAYISSRTGAFQVWRINIDGGNPVQLTNGGGKNFPAISRDGKWVLYNATDNWDLWRVPADGGEPVQVSEQPALFPSVSPDGTMIACFGRSEPKAALLILSSASGQPLRKLDLAGQTFSGTRIQWTPDGKALVYARQQDGVTSLVKQPLTGGRAQAIMEFEDELFDFGYSPDGRMLAVTRGGWQHDIVLISDLNIQ
jgi:Tol biopolymer transport system component/DNA-binding winged helix-turn-helix (wHTH) protein